MQEHAKHLLDGCYLLFDEYLQEKTSVDVKKQSPFCVHSQIHFNLRSSIPSPPLPHSRLKSLIPVTISVNSFSCLSLSRLVRDMKVPSSVWGNTLCRAAVKLMKMLGMKILQRKQEKQLDINKTGKPLNTTHCPNRNYRSPKIYVDLAVFTPWVAIFCWTIWTNCFLTIDSTGKWYSCPALPGGCTAADKDYHITCMSVTNYAYTLRWLYTIGH